MSLDWALREVESLPSPLPTAPQLLGLAKWINWTPTAFLTVHITVLVLETMCAQHVPTEGLRQSSTDGHPQDRRAQLASVLANWQAGYLTTLVLCEIKKCCIKSTSVWPNSQEGKGTHRGYKLETELNPSRADRNRT